MRKLLPVAVLGVVALVAYQRSHRPAPNSAQVEAADQLSDPQVEHESPRIAVTGSSRYRCDGRTHCSQMTSCEEATWFLEHCPGVKMDGEGDGVPCERQWCGNH